MKQSPARVALVLLFVFIGCFGTAYAAAGMLTALPAPAVGGTCGPSTGSETALEALAEPGSIGAGPEPPASNATGHKQWKTFTEQCQSLADRRGLASLAIFVISLAVASIGLILVFRRPRAEKGSDATDDESSDWPAEPGMGDRAQLVGAGAVASAPGATMTSAWGGPPSRDSYPAQPPTWPAAPAPPYPYGPPPGYPPQAAYPSGLAYPPPYPPPGSYPAYPPPGYMPPGYPAYSPPPGPPPGPSTLATPLGPTTDETTPAPTSDANEDPPGPQD